MPELKNVNVTSTMIMIEKGMQNMSSLYDRLKPEYKAKLQLSAIEFPNTIQGLINELTENNSILYLRYGTVCTISMYLDLKFFDITEILNLFEEP